MHVRQAIRDAVAQRLTSAVGPLVDGRVYTGRLAAYRASEELPCIDVSTPRSKFDQMSFESGAQIRTFVLDVSLMEKGPESDMVDEGLVGELSYSDAMDDLAEHVEAALAQTAIREDRLGVVGPDATLIDWAPADDVGSAQGPRRDGVIAALVLRFVVTVVHRDGLPVV